MKEAVQGTAKLLQLMTRLDFSGRNELYEGLKKASQPIIDSAQAKVNVRTGNLRASIGFIERRKKPYYKSVVLIGPRTYSRWAGYHAHLVEYGTVKRSIKATKTRGEKLDPEFGNRGAVMPGKFAFMAPAFKETEPIVRNNINKLVKKLFDDQIKKHK